jgi:DNA-binding ferritin-like protein
MNEQPARNTSPSATGKTAMVTPTQQALWNGRGLSFFGLHKWLDQIAVAINTKR